MADESEDDSEAALPSGPRTRSSCSLCQRIEEDDTLRQNELAVAVPDAFPVSPGHSLVLSRRHVADFFDLTVDEQRAILDLVNDVKADVDAEFRPDGYNVGVNVGEAGGQTIPHVHVHVIPRYAGDMEDPRGGVRWIFPERARYWR